jgi:hypothetical protein
MLFKSSPELRSHPPSHTTLVDVHDAADTSITALPTSPATMQTKQPASFWQRILARIKEILVGKKEEKGAGGVDVGGKEMKIGEPTGFQHHVTGGAEPLRTAQG